MNKVKMKALDTFHASNVQAENILAGDDFEINEVEAKQLEDRKLAKRVGGAKAEPAAPENKMEAASANKGLISAAGITAPNRKLHLKGK